MNGELMLLTRATSDSKWLQEHIDEVRKDNENKFVAVEDGVVIDSNNSFEELNKSLKTKGKPPAMVLIRFIHKKGEVLIL